MSHSIFDNILDLPGIEGACLFAPSGAVALNKLPNFVTPEALGDAQRRISALYETIDENFQACDDYLLRFSERWLMLRRVEKFVLVVLGADTANIASTRMVVNMAVKRMTPDVLTALTPPPPAPRTVATTPAPSPAPATPAPTQYFNGIPVPPPLPPSMSRPPMETAAATVTAPPPEKKKRIFRGQEY
jgi:hypothetical protein